MKKFHFIFAAILFAATAMFTSCEDDGLAPEPTMNITSVVAANDYVAGETVVYTLQISSNADLQTFAVSSGAFNPGTGSGVASSTPADAIDAIGEFSNNLTNVTVVYNYVIGTGIAAGSEITVLFTVTDKDAMGTQSAVPFTVIDAATDLSNETTDGVIYHILGPNQGAWDLVENAGKSSGDDAADKDMINQTDNVGGSFLAEWKAGNATTFVKADGFDYAAATDVAAETAYAAGTATDHVTGVVADDIYIAKLRGGADYAVIKIVEILDDGGVSNADYVKFTYKKKPASTSKSTGATELVNF